MAKGRRQIATNAGYLSYQKAKIWLAFRRKREITNTDLWFSLPIIIIIVNIIIFTVSYAKFNLSDQPYLHGNVNTTDNAISYTFQHFLSSIIRDRKCEMVCLVCSYFSACKVGLINWTYYLNFWGTRWRSWLRHCATSRKVAGSISDGVIGIFHWHNPSGRTMALGLTQPLTEMSTKNISWG